MCGGCHIYVKGEISVDIYLALLEEYKGVIASMKGMNSKYLLYENLIDDPAQRKVMSKFRRKLIRAQKDYARAFESLNDMPRLEDKQ